MPGIYKFSLSKKIGSREIRVAGKWVFLIFPRRLKKTKHFFLRTKGANKIQYFTIISLADLEVVHVQREFLVGLFGRLLGFFGLRYHLKKGEGLGKQGDGVLEIISIRLGLKKRRFFGAGSGGSGFLSINIVFLY